MEVAAVPLLQQWTMATPVNTLCSFPFSLQDTTGPSGRPCGVSETAPPLPPPGSAGPGESVLGALGAGVGGRPGRLTGGEAGAPGPRQASLAVPGGPGSWQLSAASLSGPFALLGADTQGG